MPKESQRRKRKRTRKRNKAAKLRNQKKKKHPARTLKTKIRMLYWPKLKRISQKITEARIKANQKFQWL